MQVDISGLIPPDGVPQYGPDHALHFNDVKLAGVRHGTISFSVYFELKPVFALFPGTPVHASAAQALRRRPPDNASCFEIFRDEVLRFLSRKLFLYFAVGAPRDRERTALFPASFAPIGRRSFSSTDSYGSAEHAALMVPDTVRGGARAHGGAARTACTHCLHAEPNRRRRRAAQHGARTA